LEENNPSARDPRVRAAKKAMMEKGIVPKILAQQKKGGYWEKAEDFYVRAKYKGTLWQLIILARLDFEDPRTRDAAEFILSKQDPYGRWTLENTYNGRFRVDIEKKGKPSKWVTLLALKALKPYLPPPCAP
jgi:hypothetical protein